MAESRNFLRVIADPSSAQIDIVAVHGLNYTDRKNHAELTWTAPNGKMWLKDFLPTQIPSARILMFGYNAAVSFEVSTAGVDEQAENLLNRLRGKRRGGAEGRPIMFICYSLGGIIVKRALVGAKLDETYKSIRSLCHGGDFATLGEIAGSIARVSLQNTFQEALTKDSLFADSIVNDFRHQLEDRYVVTFYETLPVKDLGIIIVDKKSARLGLPGTREKRLALDTDHENLCKFASHGDDDYEQVGDNIKELAERVIEITAGSSTEDCGERLKVLEWLSEIPVVDHHYFIKSNRLVETGDWLLKKPDFIKWKESELSSILWLHGIAGAGKSKLASLVVDEFRQNGEEANALAYFYCNYGEDERRDPECILRAIVKQLSTVDHRSPLPPSILSVYRERERGGFQAGPLKLEESKDLILELTSNFEQTIICIDALDECHRNTREKLLHALQYILHSSNLRSSGSRIKIFVTSRDDDDIVLKLEDTPNIYIKSSDNTSDINYFIETEIENCICLKKILRGSVESELKERIITTLINGAHGMFLWAHLQILSICQEMTAAAIERALTRLPKDLAETFERILVKIGNQSPENSALAKKALDFILCAQQPLSPDEICEALYIQPMDKKPRDNNDLNEAIILAICQNLVVVDSELKVLRFAHLSVQDFLRERFGSSYGHTQLAEICLTILSWPNYGSGYCKVIGRARPETTHAFAEYSTKNWAAHIRLSSSDVCTALEERPLVKLQQEFLRSCPAYELWCEVQKFWSHQPLYTSREASSGEGWVFIDPFLVACHFGLLEICRHFLGAKADRGAVHWEEGTSLHYAAAQGHEIIVGELLREVPFWKAGLLSTKRAIVKRSLSRWVNCKDKAGQTPLFMAAFKGHDGVVNQLLQVAGVDVNCKNEDGLTPLFMAVLEGHDGVVNQLLQVAGVDVNCKNEHGLTPLYMAALMGHDGVVKQLQAARADFGFMGSSI